MTAVLAASAALAWACLALLRAGFWRVRFPPASPAPASWPGVVAIVPARDEASVIGPAVESLLQQAYPGHFHVILVDDHSSDGTVDIAASTAAKSGLTKRLSVIRARDLPQGWAGKVWAQAEGVREQQRRFTDTRYLFLTDADIAHDQLALRRLVARAESSGLVLASEMVRLRCVTLPEKACMPAFVFFFAMLYPFALVNDPASKVAAAAGGSMLARADALANIGGIAAIKDALIDDCALAARLKNKGAIRLDLTESSHSLRPCDDWSSAWNMIARSAYTQLRHSPLLLGATVLAMLWLFVLPPLLALATGSLFALAGWLIMMCLYLPMLRYYGRSPLWAVALPLVALFYSGATVASAWRHHRGCGGRWKGRTQPRPS